MSKDINSKAKVAANIHVEEEKVTDEEALSMILGR